MHVFPFSARKGTRAENLPGKVRAGEITERSARLRQMSDTRYASFLASQVGRKFEVLLERPSETKPGVWLGHTENYLPTFSRVESGAEKTLITATAVGSDGDKLVTE
jgi:threonylcarbamoyladenosine tRNA methylthiotransferase MtaB